MKQQILFLTLLLMSSLTYAQESPPPISSMKVLTTATRYFNPVDSSVWTFKGKDLGWHREGKFSEIEASKPKIGSGLHLSGDTVKLGGTLSEPTVIGLNGKSRYAVSLLDLTSNDYRGSAINVDGTGTSMSSGKISDNGFNAYGLLTNYDNVYIGYIGGDSGIERNGFFIAKDSVKFFNNRNTNPIYYYSNISMPSDTNAIAKMAWVNKKVDEASKEIENLKLSNNVFTQLNTFNSGLSLFNGLFLNGSSIYGQKYILYDYSGGGIAGLFNYTSNSDPLAQAGTYSFGFDANNNYLVFGDRNGRRKILTNDDLKTFQDSITLATVYLKKAGDTSSVRGYIDSAFIGKTKGVLGSGSAAGVSYNINSSPTINPIGNNSQAVVVLAPGRSHDRNLVGNMTQSDLSYILAGYDNTVNGLMSGVLGGAHITLGPGVTHTAAVGSLHVTSGVAGYNFLSGTLDSLSNSSFNTVSGYGSKLTNSNYSNHWGNLNSTLNQNYSTIGGTDNLMTASSVTQNNTIIGRLDTLSQTGYSVAFGRENAIFGGNYNLINGYRNKVGTSATVNYNFIASGTGNLSNGSNNFIGSGSNNVTGIYNNVSMLGSATTASQSNATYVDALIPKNVTANSLAAFDANKKLVTASQTGTGITIVTSAAPTLTGLVSVNGSASINKNVNDATPALIVNNQQGSGNIATFQYAGSQVSNVNPSGTFLSATGIANSTNTNNSYVNTSSSGTIVSRDIADNNPSLIVNQNNSASTGNIVQFRYQNSGVASVNIGGGFLGTGLINAASSNNAQINTVATGNTIRRNIADNNSALTVNLENVGSTAPIQKWQFQGVNVASVSSSGVFNLPSVANLTSANNAKLDLNVTGAVLSRNISDANPVLSITNANNSSTANIVNFANSNGLKSFINLNGEYENTVINNGIILKSPNGTRWRLTVTDTGVSQWTSL